MHTRQTTHQRVLPQPAALESVPADTAGVATKRGIDAGLPAPGVQHGRGENTPDQGVSSRATSRPAGGAAGGNSHHQHALVPVLDKRHRPLDPCHPARARQLLAKGRAVVHRQVPFVIRLKDRTIEDSTVHPHLIKLDPGSKTTGIAITRIATTDTGEVLHRPVWLAELAHRSGQIHKRMQSRAALRRRRRSRNLRYRKPRFDNRRRTPNSGLSVWLAPSIRHRVESTLGWVARLTRWYPTVGVWIEDVRFDTHKLTNPEVAGVEYQHGTLHGYEVREYLLAKFGRSCVYCDATDVPLNIDHVRPRSRGGTNRVTNLALSCIGCNQEKDNGPVDESLAHDPARLARILARLQQPLRDAASMNTTRKALSQAIRDRGHQVVTGTGGQTKFNRSRLGMPKTHALDAVAVGPVDHITLWPSTVHVIGSAGRGSYARTRSDRHGFPRLLLTRTKRHHGFATGDHVQAVVPSGKKAGTHRGRVAVRATGSFNITTAGGTVQGIHHRHVRLLQRADGYTHHHKEAPGFLPAVNDGVSTGNNR